MGMAEPRLETAYPAFENVNFLTIGEGTGDAFARGRTEPPVKILLSYESVFGNGDCPVRTRGGVDPSLIDANDPHLGTNKRV